MPHKVTIDTEDGQYWKMERDTWEGFVILNESDPDGTGDYALVMDEYLDPDYAGEDQYPQVYPTLELAVERMNKMVEITTNVHTAVYALARVKGVVPEECGLDNTGRRLIR
jgi:hypothetical protein